MERDKQIDPVLKQWLDNVLVPVMVREYLAASLTKGDNGLENSETSESEPVQ
jgi:hypothetical protein